MSGGANGRPAVAPSAPAPPDNSNKRPCLGVGAGGRVGDGAERVRLDPALTKFRRPYDAGLVESLRERTPGAPPLEFMVVDLECVNRKNRPSLTQAVEPACPYNQQSVPVCKLHGVTAAGMTVTANVYGFFPFIYLACTPRLQEDALGELADELERILSATDERWCGRVWKNSVMQRVLRCEIVEVYDADGYHRDPIQVVKVVLAIPQYSTYLGELFFNGAQHRAYAKERGGTDDPDVNLPTFGEVRFKPYNCFAAAEQFTMESDVVGFGWVRCSSVARVVDQYGDGDDDGGRYSDRGESQLEVDVRYCDLRALDKDEKPDIAPLRVMTFDIECGNHGGFPDPSRDPIISVSIHLSDQKSDEMCQVLLQHGGSDPLPDEGVVQLRFKRPGPDPGPEVEDPDPGNQVEAELMRAFGALVHDVLDPDVIVGHNSQSFDVPYIVERAHQLGVCEAEWLGRAKAPRTWRPPREVVKQRKNGDSRVTKQTSTPGRVQLDTMLNVMADPFRRESSYSLNALARKYLDDGKDDVGYKMIHPLWRTSDATRARLGHYNLKDTQLTFKLAAKFQMLLTTIQLCRYTRLMPNRLLSGGQQIRVMQQLMHVSKSPRWDPRPDLRAALPFEVPQEVEKDDKCDGATVLNAKRGFYASHPVAVLDYASLYPSVMCSKNVDYGTLVRDKRVAERLRADKSCRRSPAGTACFVKQHVRRGMVPDMLFTLLDARKVAKKEKDDAKDQMAKQVADSKQNAIKICCNSIYGFMNASGGRLRRTCMAEAVTSWGRKMIATAKGIAEREFGCVVLYGDTDSIMLLKEDVTDVRAMFDLMKRIADRITSTINQNPVRIEPEKVLRYFLLLGKKHYAAQMMLHPDAKPILLMKGIETARRDYCPFVTGTLTRMLRLLMGEGAAEGEPADAPTARALDHLRGAIARLRSHDVKMSELIITRNLSKLKYHNKQAHAELAKRMAARDKTFHYATGERIPYLIVNRPGQTELCQKAETPMEVVRLGMVIDYEYYLNHQLRDAACRMLSPVLVPEDTVHAVADPDRIDTTLTVCTTESRSAREARKKAEKKQEDAHMKPILARTEHIIFDADVLRRQTKRVEVSSGVGIGAYFKKAPRCPACGRDPGATRCGKYCGECAASGARDEDQRKVKASIVDVEQCLEGLRRKCARCRGYDDDTPCVQQDCEVTYEKIEAGRRKKTLADSLDDQPPVSSPPDDQHRRDKTTTT